MKLDLALGTQVTEAEVHAILTNGLKQNPTLVAYGNTCYMKNFEWVKAQLK